MMLEQTVIHRCFPHLSSIIFALVLSGNKSLVSGDLKCPVILLQAPTDFFSPHTTLEVFAHPIARRYVISTAVGVLAEELVRWPK